MARMPRVVVPGYSHHVTQRGNRRQRTFCCDGDYGYYTELLSEAMKAHGTEVWAYCLMPNHVHLVMVPREPDGLRATRGGAGPNGGVVHNDWGFRPGQKLTAARRCNCDIKKSP